MKKIAVIPAYNEEKTIRTVIEGLNGKVDEIVVVDDGSTDRTIDILRSLDVVVISHQMNMGYGEAMRSGFRKGLEIGGDIFLLIDADLQHDPNESKELMEFLIKNNHDVVVGSRFMKSRSRIPLYRRLGIKFFTALTRILIGVRLTDAQSGFRVFTRDAIEKVVDFRAGNMGSSIEILFLLKKNNIRIKEFPITCSYENVRYSVNPITHGLQLINSLMKTYLRSI